MRPRPPRRRAPRPSPKSSRRARRTRTSEQGREEGQEVAPDADCWSGSRPWSTVRSGICMKLVVGLGNPGAKYDGTRHNVGFDGASICWPTRHGLEWEAAPRGIEALVARWRVGDAMLAKPLTFMNLSGPAVRRCCSSTRSTLEDMLVIVDEVQLETGRLRMQARGIGRRAQRAEVDHRVARHRWVSRGCGSASGAGIRGGTSRTTCSRGSTPDERAVIDEAIARAADASEMFVADGVVGGDEPVQPEEKTGRRQDATNESEDN